jgi:hypothetical protein
MRQYVPRQIRATLSPLRKSAVRPLRRVMHRVMANVGDVSDYSYVFVVSYGRSGSTLLMGLLNSIPGYRIRGENYNTLYRLYQADAAISQAYEKFSGADNLAPQSSWYGTPLIRPAVYRAELIDNFVSNILRPESGDRVLGFKEIRYMQAHMTDLAEYLSFLRGAFPKSKIIFNHRDPAAVARSAWWAKVENAEQRIKAADDRFLTFAADDRHHHFNYDDIDDSLDNVRELFRFLGEPFDEKAVRGVLNKPYSPYPAGNAPAARAGRP